MNDKVKKQLEKLKQSLEEERTNMEIQKETEESQSLFAGAINLSPNHVLNFSTEKYGSQVISTNNLFRGIHGEELTRLNTYLKNRKKEL